MKNLKDEKKEMLNKFIESTFNGLKNELFQEVLKNNLNISEIRNKLIKLK